VKSRVSYLDIPEVSSWIATQLEKEGVAIEDHLVRRILNRETAFLLMVGLARAGDENGPQSGHIFREACWVLKPSAETAVDQRVEPELEEVEAT